jgi:hypothetical protein
MRHFGSCGLLLFVWVSAACSGKEPAGPQELARQADSAAPPAAEPSKTLGSILSSIAARERYRLSLITSGRDLSAKIRPEELPAGAQTNQVLTFLVDRHLISGWKITEDSMSVYVGFPGGDNPFERRCERSVFTPMHPLGLIVMINDACLGGKRLSVSMMMPLEDKGRWRPEGRFEIKKGQTVREVLSNFAAVVNINWSGRVFGPDYPESVRERQFIGAVTFTQ